MTSPLFTRITPEQGLHFTLTDSLIAEPNKKCSNYILHRFPIDVFVDPYELEQRAEDGVGPSSQVWGLTDLELPVSSVLDQDGSLLLLGPLKDVKKGTALEVEIPVHARYPIPLKGSATHANVTLPEPTLLNVCKGKSKNANLHTDLFSPYNSPFDFKTTTIQTKPFTSENGLVIRIPAGNQADLAFVEPLTVVVVLLAAFYMGRAVWKTSKRVIQSSAQEKREKQS